MHQSIFNREFADRKHPLPNPLVVVIMVFLWLTFACGLPIHQVREARRQARQNLLATLAADKLDKATILATFERANQDLDAAASGPCIILAVTIIFVVRQTLKLKRRYNEVELDLKDYQGHGHPSEAEPAA